MTQEIRAFGPKNTRIRKHDRIDFAHTLHCVEERHEEHQCDGECDLGPEAKTQPKHKDWRKNDAWNSVQALDEGIKDTCRATAEAQPDTCSNAESCSDQVAENGFRQSDRYMAIETCVGYPLDYLIENIKRCREENTSIKPSDVPSCQPPTIATSKPTWIRRSVMAFIAFLHFAAQRRPNIAVKIHKTRIELNFRDIARAVEIDWKAVDYAAAGPAAKTTTRSPSAMASSRSCVIITTARRSSCQSRKSSFCMR